MSGIRDLEKLVEDNKAKVASLEAGPRDILSEMESLKEEMEEATSIKDEQQRNIRLQVLNAKLDELRQAVKKEEQDLAEAVLGLNAIMANIGGDFSQLTELNDVEKALIEKAENAVAQAKERLTEAEDAWFFKEKRVAEANDDIKQAEHLLTKARAEADKMMRQRLLNHSLEDSLQEFQMRVVRTIDIMKKRLKDITAQVQAVSVRKNAAFEAKQQAAEDLAQFKQQVEETEGELVTAESNLMEYANGSAEYTKQEQLISELKARLEEATGFRNQALAVFQSKEKYATELEVHEVAQKRLQANQLMWIKSLESDTEESVVTYRSRLEAMKSSSDQEIAQELDKLGARLQQANTEYMAKVSVASEQLAQDKFAQAPERYRKLIEIQAAQTEALAKAGLNMKEMVKGMVEKYGIDKTLTHHDTYVD